MKRWWLLLPLLVMAMLCCGRMLRAENPHTLTVGPGKDYPTPSAAAAVAKDGDIVEIEAGAYPGDVARWAASHLIIRGVHGRAVLDSGGKAFGGKAIWVIAGDDTTIEHIEFANCRVPDKNGAGIRQEGAGLTARDCIFRENEDGILAGANPKSDIHLLGCELARNGAGDGYSHNIYIGHVRTFTMENCWSHGAKIGHLVKSRAETTVLLYNRLMDEADGTSSYVIDIPNGGKTVIIGNVIQHGPKAENGMVVSYAAEGATNPVQALYFASNTVINERARGGFLRTAGQPKLTIINNLFTGSPGVLAGVQMPEHNLVTDAPGFVDAAKYNYHLETDSPAVGKAVDPWVTDGVALLPTFEYTEPMNKIFRQTAHDFGAFEHR